ncbi:hypothetical protein BGZ97_004858 [Linnemannia gamsii]|uniref:DASH complex subunit SPC19 n=1 Tax=Linnemannia gamsii TaxID=64522 RepID=A0A9P6REE7_9FUNG|nr:hypothetical protein BGZ97_004858 [Linnemannia gamsii]
MDTHGNGFGYGGSYTNNNTNQGHAGHGHNDYGGSNGPRRTYTPITSASSIFMPSLKRCVNTLDMSTQLLKSSVSMLDEATSGYPRLKTIASYNKKYHLVSEQDITKAREEVTKEVSPQLTFLSEKVANIIFALEAKEYELMDLVNVEKEKEQRRLQLQKAASSGLSNIKKLKSLTKRKEELSRSASELDEVLDQKRQQFSQLLKRVSTGGSTSVPAKKQRRGTNHESRELAQLEEDRRNEIARRNRELQAIQQKIEDKQKAVRELRAKSAIRDGDNSAGQDVFTPTVPWNLYLPHREFLERFDADILVDERDKDAYSDAFTRLSEAYLRELEPQQAMVDIEQNKLTREKSRKVWQMRNLCKQLFPEDSIGITMVRILEMLVENPDSELAYKSERVQAEFPPEEERRHNLGRVVTILKNLGVVELAVETRIPEGQEPQEDNGEQELEEQLIVRIKFEDS